MSTDVNIADKRVKAFAIHLSMTPLEYDARINRTITALNRAGFPSQGLAPGSGLNLVPMTKWRKLRLALVFLVSSRFGNDGALRAFWSFGSNHKALKALIALRPTLIHAHDWDALPIAEAASKKLSVPYIYDSHEYASHMHRERILWRLSMSRAIGLIETACLRKVTAVITVSDGIADILKTDHNLRVRPTVLRNVPEYVAIAARPLHAERLLLHYHGVLAAGRGIEAALESLMYLPEKFHLQIVGPERQTGFIARLNELAKKFGLSGRLAIKPAVKPEELVLIASGADFGFCLLDNSSEHNRLALPNKIFEYIMAGLYCVTSNGPDMANIIFSHGAGLVLDRVDPQVIAKALLAVSPEQLLLTRQKNLQTAMSLNWAVEKDQLISTYHRVLS